MKREPDCICGHPSIVHPAGDGCCVDDCACRFYQAGKAKKPHKFNAKRTAVDGIGFDSKHEADRWGVLKLLEKAGRIYGLARQFKFPLETVDQHGRTVCIGFYEADFAYFEKARPEAQVVEDAKGVRTPLYTWKRRHMEAQYGIRIQEV